MIAIIDYNTGNLFSLTCALDRLGEKYVLTSSREVISSADSVILPGVGEASSAMENLKDRGLDKIIPSLNVPVLGICIGMQLMCKSSEEGKTKCMGIFPNEVKRLKGEGIKVPHMGWNSVREMSTQLFAGIEEGEYLYFVHSYAPTIGLSTISLTTHGQEFSSALASGNFFGTQFHPEKSGDVGVKILRNFIDIKTKNLWI